MQCLEAVADADAVLGAAIVRKLLLKGLHLPAQDIPRRPHEAEVGLVQLRFEFLVRANEVQERHLHAAAPPMARRYSL